MKNQNNIKQYLIKVFMITLLLVGIAELLINILYLQFLTPVLDQTFHFDQLLSNTNLSQLLAQSGETIFWWITKSVMDILPSVISEPLRLYATKKMDQTLFMNLIRHQHDIGIAQSGLSIFLLLMIIFLLILLWFLPFIIAAIVFSALVNKKVLELEQIALENQKEYERQRYLLLSDMAHDLKTPITTISGYANALLHHDVPTQSTESYLNAIYQKSLQMNHIITLLFEYVRLDSAGFALHQTSENYSELVRGCVASLYAEFEGKDMQIHMMLPEEDLYARVDKVHLERAINNLLVNAYKHNPSGTTVTVLMKTVGDQIILRVYDDGTRIAPSTLLHIFEPFVQGDASRTSNSGTGLGLSISKKVVEMHGGTLTLHQVSQTAQKNFTKVFELVIPSVSDSSIQ